MKIEYFNESKRTRWDSFVQTNALDGGLLQSWYWGEFQSRVGCRVVRLSVQDETGDLLTAQILNKKIAGFFSYLYLPRGPVFSRNLTETQKTAVLSFFFSELIKLAKESRAVFIRFEPTENLPNIDRARKIADIQPGQTLFLDLTKPSEQLLAEMKAKTRYNIKVAQHYGVQVKVVTKPSEFDFNIFWRLVAATSQRQKIKSHDKNYYYQMLDVLSRANLIKLYLASWENEFIAANLMVECGDWLYYLHGASADEHKNLMAPYLLHWQAITEAQAAGKKYYDFWGVSSSKESWQGITRFKQGFAPNQEFTVYPGCFELAVNNFWYKVYQLLKKIKN